MENRYKTKITKKAEKFFKKQDNNTQKRILKSITELPKGDIKKLKGFDGLFRLRVGDLRVLFEKNDEELIIIVIDIGNRGEIYK